MSAKSDPSHLTVTQFAERFRGEMIPLSHTFSYFCASPPLTEEDMRDYLQEPIAALPPDIAAKLPKVSILLVPYLSKDKASESKTHSSEVVSLERPPVGKQTWTSQVRLGDQTVLAFALKDHEVAEYHYRFYQHIARMVADLWKEDVNGRYAKLLIEELAADVRGEVDEESWREKQAVENRGTKLRPESKAFRAYVKASFIDTMTLFLHGVCCDIDVETGPRQLPSNHLRKRLLLLREIFPPPKDYYLLPEDMKSR